MAAQQITQSAIENRLWEAADQLRVAMPEAQYASVIFPLMFWKYLSDTWDHNHALFLEENQGLEDLSKEEAHEIEYRDYQSFEIPLTQRRKVGEMRASWSAVRATITQPGLGARVRTCLRAIEAANPDKFSKLFGSLAWTSDEVLRTSVLTGVMRAMDRVPAMHEGNMSHDVLGGAYEFLLKRFSDGSGTRAGQFFTPREVVELITEILDPQNFESVYDPTCGSGGMLISAANLLKSHGGRGYSLHLYGQESVGDTAGVARMNLFMHNLTQFEVEVGDTLKSPQFKQPDGSVAQFDVVVANPPYSLKWTSWTTDPRAIGGIAPRTSADWAFVQHMIASMKPGRGRVGVVLPHGVLFRGGQEGAIRRKVIEDDLLEAVIGLPKNLFYATEIATCILVLRAPGTKPVDRQNGVLFVDASQRYAKSTLRNVLADDDIAVAVSAYKAGGLTDRPSEERVQARFVTHEEINSNVFDLSVSRYIKQVAGELEDLGALIDGYNLARARRQKTEGRMFAVLADAGVEGLDE